MYTPERHGSRYGFEKHSISYDSNKPTSDNVYIDIKVNNDTDSRGVLAKYSQTRLEPLLSNPSNYYLALVRWKIPGFSLPLLIFPIQNGQGDPNLSEYSVTLETSTDIVQFYLHFVSYNVPQFPPTTANPTQEPSPYYFIFDYQQMLNILNDALLNAHNTLTGKPVGSVAPFLIYDPTTKLFSIIATQADYGVDLTPSPIVPTFDAPIKIYFNFKLFSLFNGFPSRITTEGSVESTQGRDVQILISDYNNAPLGDNQVIQDFTSISYWSPVKQVVFITELIPANSENTAVSNDSFRKILTDFEPIPSSNQDVRTTYQYFPQGQYRLIDMIGTKPLYNIDLQVKWLDINGNEYYVTIPPFQQFTAKMLFVKRNLYKTDNLIFDQ